MKKSNFKLVGHLQVLDEPLSSLYLDSDQNKYFLFVRLYEDSDDETYVLSSVIPSEIIDYIDKKVTLSHLFTMRQAYHYNHTTSSLCENSFIPINTRSALSFLQDDGGLDDVFNDALACKSVALKHYLYTM